MATTEQEMVVRGGRRRAAHAEERMKPARVLAAGRRARRRGWKDRRSTFQPRPKSRPGLDRRLQSQAAEADRGTTSTEQADYFAELASRQVATIGEPTHKLRVLGSDLDLAHPVRQPAALPAQQDHREQRARPVPGGALHQPGDEHLQPHLRHHHPRRPRLQGAIEQVNLTDVTNGLDSPSSDVPLARSRAHVLLAVHHRARPRGKTRGWSSRT